jgi:multidrug efflux system outer membrane protein
MKKQRLIYTALITALLTGCSFTPDYERPIVDTPAGWSEANASETTVIAKDWWKNFNNPELNAMMEEALAKNNDIAASIQRIEQARALAKIAGAPLLPSIEGDASGGWQRVNPGEGDTQSDATGTAGLSVGYELDIFGLNRAELESAQADVESFQYASDALALIVMADVAKGYFNVLNFEERLSIADQNLESARELLRIVQARFDAGATTLLDVAQQKSDLASTEAERAASEQQMKIARNSLAILLGKAPQNLVVNGKDLRSIPVPEIAPGQPSSLLVRRPDIRSAEAELLAANADIGAARAAFFPQINIGLDIGIAATPLGDPATTTASLLGGLIAPIFKGGLLEGNLAYTKARKAELVENYRKTVLVSFKDVEDSLASLNAAQKRETALETAMNEARKAYDLSKQQYDVGSIDFQILLDARQTMLLAETNYIQTKNDRLAAAVDLYKALGGGWAEKTQ